MLHELKSKQRGIFMNKIKRNIYKILILSAFFTGSCATWNAENIADLKQKIFYLQRFSCSQRGFNSKTALEKMGKFPTEQILKILSHKYNIIVDSSEFENVILSGSNSELQTKGLLVPIEFIWENKNKHTNTIEIEYENLSPLKGDPTDIIPQYIISLKIDGKKKVELMGKIIDKTQILASIAKGIGYLKQNENSDNYYINKETKSIVDLTIIEAKDKKIAAKENLETKFKQNIKNYMDALPQEEKIKFRDNFVKFLYTIE
jgi:hypothetical protein